MRRFDSAYPSLNSDKFDHYTPEEFAQFYDERGNLAKEIREWTRTKAATKVPHELSDPEVGEFFEYLHTGYEIGLEDKVHMLSQIPSHQYDLFEKFVKVLSGNPDFFNNIHLLHKIPFS
uniref:Uncharacterized protein n=1 Tax=Strombidium rassoulzadegani TaxID=1082188 RepID=A0A7S3CLW3_9SPIT|mmetsp:Transcript_16478/g.27978  ORF Transcript_16478/g.27978 Transcript_16478/m.27978 type:complete len:119 (+) Transcript_16478:657-1013(+)